MAIQGLPRTNFVIEIMPLRLALKYIACIRARGLIIKMTHLSFSARRDFCIISANKHYMGRLYRWDRRYQVSGTAELFLKDCSHITLSSRGFTINDNNATADVWIATIFDYVMCERFLSYRGFSKFSKTVKTTTRMLYEL